VLWDGGDVNSFPLCQFCREPVQGSSGPNRNQSKEGVTPCGKRMIQSKEGVYQILIASKLAQRKECFRLEGKWSEDLWCHFALIKEIGKR